MHTYTHINQYDAEEQSRKYRTLYVVLTFPTTSSASVNIESLVDLLVDCAVACDVVSLLVSVVDALVRSSHGPNSAINVTDNLYTTSVVHGYQ